MKFSKGNIPWNKDIKGIHLSETTEFKKGCTSPNKGKKFPYKPRPGAIGRIAWNKGRTDLPPSWSKGKTFRKKDIKGFTLSLETNSNFVEVKSFIDQFMNQRRLKMVRNLSIIKDTKDGTGSASLKIKMDISGYYL